MPDLQHHAAGHAVCGDSASDDRSILPTTVAGDVGLGPAPCLPKLPAFGDLAAWIQRKCGSLPSALIAERQDHARRPLHDIASDGHAFGDGVGDRFCRGKTCLPAVGRLFGVVSRWTLFGVVLMIACDRIRRPGSLHSCRSRTATVLRRQRRSRLSCERV